jgi:hypothetical protein
MSAANPTAAVPSMSRATLRGLNGAALVMDLLFWTIATATALQGDADGTRARMVLATSAAGFCHWKGFAWAGSHARWSTSAVWAGFALFTVGVEANPFHSLVFAALAASEACYGRLENVGRFVFGVVALGALIGGLIW